MAIQTLSDLRALFVKQSTETGKRLGYVRQSYMSDAAWGSMRLGEEGITNSLLLDLYDQGCRVLHFKQTSRRDEAISGIDFELWIGSENKGWLRFAIQAKKLDVKTGRYSSLAHETPSRQQQIELLEDYAGVERAAPIYCLYNHTADAAESEHWHCCTGPADLKELGCTVTPSINIRKAIGEWGGKNFNSIHKNQNTLPLKCLLCPKVWDSPGSMSEGRPTGQAGEMPTLFDPRTCYHRTLPQALIESFEGAVVSENERGGSRASISADEYWDTDGAMDTRREVGRPKAVALLEVRDTGNV